MSSTSKLVTNWESNGKPVHSVNKYSPTIGPNSIVGYNHWWSHISDFSNRFKIRSTRSLPPTIGTTMVVGNEHKTKLAEEYSYLSKKQNKY